MTVTVTLDDALNGTVSRDNVSRLATMPSGGLAITHVRNLQGRRHIVNPIRLKGWCETPMSALGQKRTYALQQAMSALPPIPDTERSLRHVCFGPEADMFRSERRRRMQTGSGRSASRVS